MLVCENRSTAVGLGWRGWCGGLRSGSTGLGGRKRGSWLAGAGEGRCLGERRAVPSGPRDGVGGMAPAAAACGQALS